MAATLGYDDSFLPAQVPLPAPLRSVPTVELDYTHFTVLHRPDRRLAAVTAVNIDGAELRDLDRAGIDWRLDNRLPPRAQAGDEVYDGNDLDRGHLVRRRDPVWGELAEATTANIDTFHYTNAAPQVAVFNQSKDLWLGLEDYILGHADATQMRRSVLTGPVLADDDPVYRGLPLPRHFWKIAAWVRGEELATSGYLLEQTDLLAAMLDRDSTAIASAASAPELGAYRTFQVPITNIAALTGLDLNSLERADSLTEASPAMPQTTQHIELTSWSDIAL